MAQNQIEEQIINIAPMDSSINVTGKRPEEKETKNPFDIQEKMKRYFTIRNQFAREFLAEAIGTFILVVFGCGSVAQYKFGSFGHFESICIAFGFGAALAGIMIGKVSGGHINPAVSFAMLITGKIRWDKFLIYCLGQFVGAFIGAFFVWSVYFDKINNYSRDYTIGIFSTFPINSNLSTFGGLFDQLFATSLLVIVVLAVSDKKNVELASGSGAILVGLTITTIGLAYGHNCGFAINPARDFGPRLFTSIAGWGSSPFQKGNYFFWIPIVGPMFGSIFGVFVYSIFISNNWP